MLIRKCGKGSTLSVIAIFFSLILIAMSVPVAAQDGEPIAETAILADVVIETKFGDIGLTLFPDVAPGHVENFLKLAKSKFYDGTLFHRVIPGFMIQGGDPNSKEPDRAKHGSGGPGYSIAAEFNDRPHERGTLSMARSSNPDSAGSQFFIVVKNANFLDGQYTVFGKVISGMEIADKIVAQERDARDNPIESVPMTIRVTDVGLSK